MPRRKKHPKPRSRQPGRGAGIRTRWTELRPFFDYWGAEIPRYYKLETLSSAVDYALQTKKDQFILPSIQRVLGPSPVVSLTFELFQEGRYQLIFRVKALNARRKQGSFALVAAKKAEDYKLAAKELANLRVLYGRAPDFIVRPFQGGKVYLPDRYGRTEHGREIFAYVTQWLSSYHELGVNENLQFIVNIKARHTFTIAQTEDLKAKMVEIVARTYSPAKRNCADIPEIASGDFVVTMPPKPRLKLIACRRMLRNMNPVKLLDRVAAAAWPWGESEFFLAPQDPAMLYGAIARAWGSEETRKAFEQYAAALDAGKFQERLGLPRNTLEELIRTKDQ